MDAVEYRKTTARLCGTEPTCSDCEIMGACFAKRKNPEAMVNAVEKWAKEHPAKTRQSEFLKMFPNAVLKDGTPPTPPIEPCNLEPGLALKCKGRVSCLTCRRKFWLEEIE